MTELGNTLTQVVATVGVLLAGAFFPNSHHSSIWEGLVLSLAPASGRVFRHPCDSVHVGGRGHEVTDFLLRPHSPLSRIGGCCSHRCLGGGREAGQICWCASSADPRNVVQKYDIKVLNSEWVVFFWGGKGRVCRVSIQSGAVHFMIAETICTRANSSIQYSSSFPPLFAVDTIEQNAVVVVEASAGTSAAARVEKVRAPRKMQIPANPTSLPTYKKCFFLPKRVCAFRL